MLMAVDPGCYGYVIARWAAIPCCLLNRPAWVMGFPLGSPGGALQCSGTAHGHGKSGSLTAGCGQGWRLVSGPFGKLPSTKHSPCIVSPAALSQYVELGGG